VKLIPREGCTNFWLNFLNKEGSVFIGCAFLFLKDFNGSVENRCY